MKKGPAAGKATDPGQCFDKGEGDTTRLPAPSQVPRRLRDLMPAPAPRTRKEWLEAAETVEPRVLAGTMQTDERGGITSMMITLGPRAYVRRVSERTAEQLSGFVVTKVRRSRPDLVNPLTGELNHVYVVRMERRQ
jgi:hypothetical protein